MSDNGISASLNHFFKENERLKQELKEVQERIELIGENRYGRFISHGEWEALRAEADRYYWLREAPPSDERVALLKQAEEALEVCTAFEWPSQLELVRARQVLERIRAALGARKEGHD